MSGQRVIVLGASGMLGSMVVDLLSRDERIMVVGTVRNAELQEIGKAAVPNADWQLFEVGCEEETARQLTALGRADWVVNAIGLTKPYTRDDNAAEIERAIVGNALFPHLLASHFAGDSGQVLQIATDCVFSGTRGHYREEDSHDPIDVYGKTKSLGEVLLPNIHHLRTSIIGPEHKSNAFLLEWLRHQPVGAELNGFTNHRWNGVTTLQFGQICHGVIVEGLELPQLQHVIPVNEVSKYELLCYMRDSFGRPDVQINPQEAEPSVDRTLTTRNAHLNERLWRAAGHGSPPTVARMVEELAAFDYRFAPVSV